MMGVAAGLASCGNTVFASSFAMFATGRAYEQVRNSIGYTHLNVKICATHAGITLGEDGASHQSIEDIALMRSLPEMEVFSPIDSIETEKIVKVLSRSRHPAYLRLVRPQTPDIFDQKLSFTIGKSYILKKGKDITVVGHGPILYQAFQSQAKLNLDKPYISLEIINCSSIKPLDTDTILKSVKKTGHLICLEDHQQQGGLGEAIASLILSNGIKCKFIHLAVNNSFGRSAKTYEKLYDYYGIGVNNLISAAKKIIK